MAEIEAIVGEPVAGEPSGTDGDDQHAITPRRPSWLTVTAGVLGLWALVFAKVGTGLIFGIDDLVARSKALPDLLVSGRATDDYINWSVLPLAIGKLFGAGTRRSFAFVQFVILVPGSVAVLALTARRRPLVAANASLGLFACMVPAWALFSMGTYDQLLIVLLLAATLADRPLPGALVGLAIGATHAEAGAIVVLGLLALSAVDLGPRAAVRAWTLAGIVASRLVVTIWFRLEGQSGDRFTFVEEYGLSKLVGYLVDTWPYVLWSAAAGGWVIIIGTLAVGRSRRLTSVVVAILALNVATTAITADQSRVIMLLSFPLVVALAAFSPRPDGGSAVANVPGTLRTLRVTGAIVGLLAPLTISWIGEVAAVGDPFAVHW
jgi:hypothetical protein